MNEQPAPPWMLAERLARKERELATVTSERDYLRERLRELVEEFELLSLRAKHGASPGRSAAWQSAAARLRQTVTDSETGGNGTATQGGQDAPTPERPT